MSERKIDPFSALILVISIIAIVLIAATDFAGFYLTGYGAGNRYSCLSCEYYTSTDLAAQIIMIILFILQIIIAINELLPNKLIDKELGKLGILLALSTMIFAIIGIASFGAYYAEFEWWPEAGFYGGIIGGLLNLILFFLKEKNIG